MSWHDLRSRAEAARPDVGWDALLPALQARGIRFADVSTTRPVVGLPDLTRPEPRLDVVPSAVG